MVEYSNANGEIKTLEVSSPFTRWFDVDGFFVAKPFQQWLASEIPLIGQVDPKNKNGDAKTAASAIGEQKKNNTPKNFSSSDATPSTRSRKGKKA